MTTAPLSFRTWTPRQCALLAGIVVTGVILRLVSFQGIGYLDSLNYAQASLAIADGSLAETLGFHQQNRLLMTVPPGLTVRLFGPSEWALVAWFFVLSTAELVLVPLLLSRVLRPGPALAAAALHGFSQVAVRSATSNWADSAMSVWTDAGMLVLLFPALRARHAAISGVLFGIASMHKETAVVLFPVVGLRLLFAGGGPRAAVSRCLAFGGAFLGVVAAECAAFGAATGDPLYRYRHVDETHGHLLQNVSRDLVHEWTRVWPGNLLQSPQMFGVALFLVPPALLASFSDPLRRREDAMLTGWFLFGSAYVIFGTSSTSAWAPLLPYPRYLVPAFLPAAILAARYLADDLPRRGLLVRGAGVLVTAGAALAAFTMSKRGADNMVPAAAALVAVVVIEVRGAAGGTRGAVAFAACAAQAVAVALAAALGEAPRYCIAERVALERVHREGHTVVRARMPLRNMLEVITQIGDAPPLTVRNFREGDNEDATGDEAFLCMPHDLGHFRAARAAGRELAVAPAPPGAPSHEGIFVLYPKSP